MLKRFRSGAFWAVFGDLSRQTPSARRRSTPAASTIALLLTLLVLPACGRSTTPADAVQGGDPVTPPPAATPAQTPAPAPTAARARIVVLGDSLAAGLGLSANQAFPAILQEKIDAAALPFEVVNAGVSGDTSASGVRRLDWALTGDVRILVVELGANDGLRGLPVEELRRNLTAIVQEARRRGLSVVLCGMEAPPNFGARYTDAFRQVYVDLAREHDLAFVPFLLNGVAGLPTLNQGDGIHPNEKGARLVADTVWAVLRPVIDTRLSSSS